MDIMDIQVEKIANQKRGYVVVKANPLLIQKLTKNKSTLTPELCSATVLEYDSISPEIYSAPIETPSACDRMSGERCFYYTIYGFSRKIFKNYKFKGES
jgi:hypothetical protein